MTKSIQTVLCLALAVGPGSALTACGSSSQQQNVGATTTAVAVPARNTQSSGQNVLQNANTLTGWQPTKKALFTVASGGPGRAKDFELTGTGSPLATDVFSAAVAVRAGHTYTFSAWVDPSKISSGSADLWVLNTARNVIYSKAEVSRGPAGRYALSVKIPNNIGQIRLGFYTSGAVIQAGQKIKFSQPALAVAANKM